MPSTITSSVVIDAGLFREPQLPSDKPTTSLPHVIEGL